VDLPEQVAKIKAAVMDRLPITKPDDLSQKTEA
jgi:hypothetical protein